MILKPSPPPASRAAIGHLAQLFSVAAYAVGLAVQKKLTDDLSPADIVAIQFIAAAVILWAGCLLAGRLPHFNRSSLLAIGWGMLAPGLSLILSSAGAGRTDGISMMLIWGALPLMVPVLGLAFLKERFHWSLVTGALIGFGGLVVLALDRQSLGAGDAIGNLLVLGGVFCAALSQIIGRRLNLAGAPWYQLATLQVTGAMILAVAVAMTDGQIVPLDPAANWHLAAFTYLILVMTVLNYMAFNLALSRIPVAWVSIYVSLNPVIGTMAAIALLGSHARLFDAIGMIVIICGVVLPHAIRLHQRRNAPV